MGTTNIVIAALFFIIIIFILAQVIIKPIKLLWKLIINSAIGLILLSLVNYGGSYFNFELDINIITVLVAGFLGIPGVLLLVCFQLLLK
ncbi:MAG: pro-sigmaK processing inhibitor BofA family protein [Syntrophomonas sp.]|nr:pro-sigmaK processing inhibitor BofA family protein [Syntrophomonas sp.]